ncbi:SusD/RagB family nutrient-binding outer membrane lipoprotein [Salegentibacter sp. Hel_I_6]|uniref:SusD/RagB family nutrient-binding outer membrane lipoprotein n=1 Tax=Salegentibacter sp. Hel_I_6 TaxID=1250278 RepID=UPI000566096B|nr:SusD/RagB family nutrient-binding outer membrane lipoprotein [Salegentibacter sp. Hel_I_6]
MKKYINKTIVFVLTVAVFGVGLVSCTDDFDINTDPLAATTVEPSLLFPTIMVGMSQNRTVELNAVNMQAQHWASTGSSGVFSNPERYTISPNTTNNVWVGHYTTVLRNLQQVRVLTETNNPEALNIIGQAKVFEGFAYLNLTQIFGDIPFSEAIQVADFPNPNFDSQEDVLRGVINRLDEGIELLQTETDIVTSGDLMYNGDRENWIRFANSLKLKALMLIANVDSSVQGEIQAVSAEPLIVENSQNAYLPYSDNIGNENPLWRTIDLFAGGDNLFFYAGSTLTEILNENNDPRRDVFFDRNDDDEIVGQDQGVFEVTGISPVSLNILRPDLEDRYATAAETHFFLAEAALKGYISGNAQEYYMMGVEASLDSYDGQPGEISASEKDAYLAARGSIEGLSTEDAIERVHIEQYVALFTRGIEGWTHWRRTKTPSFMVPENAQLDDIIRRYQYPVSEITSNPNAPSQMALDSPMWFEE